MGAPAQQAVDAPHGAVVESVLPTLQEVRSCPLWEPGSAARADVVVNPVLLTLVFNPVPMRVNVGVVAGPAPHRSS